ncbi:HEPN domain-containing protein [Amnibacterium kyonggiense]|uniref:HEPN domain-containing protein n=1 Tax=Amnibacterium kyonggiense TaxID=595671 RepID=A0A4R7FJ94_9MICO|nr:HEPN domain-containing protein [Amnibacterium kyonggiense]TDS75916.1 HEPN domain-containing protein [Amnibacterium kyonggiense]
MDLSFTWKEWDEGAVGPEAVAAQAEAFLRAGDLCLQDRDNGERSVPMVIPAVVNWCLSIELYLKALIFNDGRRAGQIHRLDRLFELLAAADREAIEQAWTPLVATLSLPGLLREVGGYFVDVRYDYEVAERAYSEGAIRLALTAITAAVKETIWRDGPLP